MSERRGRVVLGNRKKTPTPLPPRTAAVPIDDDIRLLIAQLQNPLTGVKTKEYKWRLQTHTQCFTGEEAVQWLLSNTDAQTNEQAEALGQKLLNAGAFKSLSASSSLFSSHACLYQLNTPKSMGDMDYLNDLFKEYLLYRGMTETLVTFERELKKDRFQQLEATLIVQELFQWINQSNLPSLLDLWKYLDTALFSRIDKKYFQTVVDLESSLFKYYLVHAIQSSNYSRIHEFFKTCVERISKDPKWAPWFYLPYTKNPQKHPEFAVYFTQLWVDQFAASLTNFISTCLHQAPLPRLMMFNMERAARESLEEQVATLQRQNEELRSSVLKLKNSVSKSAILKIDANKPMPAQEQKSFEDDSPVYLGKQRKPSKEEAE